MFHPEFRTIAMAGALYPVLMAGVVGVLPDVTCLKVSGGSSADEEGGD
jgi:hypothetical protein